MLKNIYNLENIELLARFDFLDLCLVGETGTGKTHTARLIHELSPRAAKPLIWINCAELAPGLIEAELFGCEKGAFTGALAARIGKFEAASGGTLFLDEIGELPVNIQAKLLKAVEEKTITPVGGNRPRPVDVRLIYATHRDLSILREDLRYRIAAHTIHLKPLRERSEEIVPLARVFLSEFSQKSGRQIEASDEMLKAFETAEWRGNIRELRFFIENVCLKAIFAGGDHNEPRRPTLLSKEMLSREILESGLQTKHNNKPHPAAQALPILMTGDKMDDYLERIETYLLKHALDTHNNNQTRAAQDLGISRSGLIKRLKRISH